MIFSLNSSAAVSSAVRSVWGLQRYALFPSSQIFSSKKSNISAFSQRQRTQHAERQQNRLQAPKSPLRSQNTVIRFIIKSPNGLHTRCETTVLEKRRWTMNLQNNCYTSGREKRRMAEKPPSLYGFPLCPDYIIPPAGAAGMAGAGSGMSTIPHSVVRNIPATDAAFSRATLDTLVGSITPASYIFTYSPVRAL